MKLAGGIVENSAGFSGQHAIIRARLDTSPEAGNIGCMSQIGKCCLLLPLPFSVSPEVHADHLDGSFSWRV